jgi:TPR repeat protein
MASLTPLSKGLIGLAVVGAMASALKERLAEPSAMPSTAGRDAPAAVVTTPQDAQRPNPEAVAVPAGSDGTSAAEHAEQGRKFMEAHDFAQARAHLEQAVKGGDAGAACLLGEMTLEGLGGLTANQDAAAKLFQLAQSRNTICFAAGQ